MTPLSVVQPEAIISHADIFRCEPYRVSLTARACVARQADARRKSTSKHSTRTTALSKCSGCALGAAVAGRLDGVEDVGAPLAVAVEPPPERRPEAPPPVSMVVRIERPAPVVDEEPAPGACPECLLVGAHKLQCSAREGRGLVLGAELVDGAVVVAVAEAPALVRPATLPPPAFATPVAVADAPAAPLPVVARALAAVRRERHREARRRAAKAHASPALERAVRGSLRRLVGELFAVLARATLALRRLVGELFAVLARATLAAAGVSPRRA